MKLIIKQQIFLKGLARYGEQKNYDTLQAHNPGKMCTKRKGRGGRNSGESMLDECVNEELPQDSAEGGHCLRWEAQECLQRENGL